MSRIIFLIKNQINRLEFKISFFILILLSVGGVAMGYIKNYEKSLEFVRSAADNFLLTSTDASVVGMLFSFLFPLMAASLCSGYKKGKEKTGNVLFPLLRMNKRQFIYGNALVTVGLTVISFMLILGLNQLLCFVAFPLSGADNRWGQLPYELIRQFHPECLFDIWTIQNPYVYNLLYIGIISVLAGGIALLTYGLGYTKRFERLKPVQLSALVFAMFIGLFIGSEFLDISTISFLSFLEPGHSVSTKQYIIFAGCIYVAGIILTIKGKKTYEAI